MLEIRIMNSPRPRPNHVLDFPYKQQLCHLPQSEIERRYQGSVTGPYVLLSLEWNASSPSTQMWLCGTTTLRSGYEGLVWTVSPSTATMRFITHDLGSEGDLLHKYGK
jgi:hypothetical protein